MCGHFDTTLVSNRPYRLERAGRDVLCTSGTYRVSYTPNGVARIFVGGGHPADATRSEADQIQWGGGVVAEIFRDPRERTRFGGGG